MGLIHKIMLSDIFIVLDDVQFVRGKNFVARTQIKTSGGPKWLSIPVHNKNDFLSINQIKINNEISWQKEHWNKIFENYKKAEYFDEYADNIKKNIMYTKWKNIAELNISLIKEILRILKIEKHVVLSSELGVEGKGLEKIINIIKAVNADEYITGTGKGSSRYVIGNESNFKKNNIKIKFQKFIHPSYSQLFENFVPNLSIIDTIFNMGPEDTLKKMREMGMNKEKI
jgi:hypothetical protein